MNIWKHNSINKLEGNLDKYIKFIELRRAKHRLSVHNDMKGNILYSFLVQQIFLQHFSQAKK